MSDTGLAPDEVVGPVAVGPGGEANGAAVEVGARDADNGAAAEPVPAPALAGADASLLVLIDRLALVLERSDLGELEVAAGATTIVLRAPSVVDRVAGPPAGAVGSSEAALPFVAEGPASAATSAVPVATANRPAVQAPLTGIFYGAPSPGAQPYVGVGDHVSVGQVIGLIEAMKLFNEIKSDLAGRVARVCVESGALVKARQPLIEVEPA